MSTDQVQPTQPASSTQSEDTVQLFNNLVNSFPVLLDVSKTLYPSRKHMTLMTFTYREKHMVGNTYSKVLLEKTDLINRLQKWLNENYADDKGKQQYFVYFTSSHNTYHVIVNWNKFNWSKHTQIETRGDTRSSNHHA
jgi:hypothetical protein